MKNKRIIGGSQWRFRKHLSVLLHVVPADTTAFWTAFIGYLSDFALKGSQEVAVASFKWCDHPFLVV